MRWFSIRAQVGASRPSAVTKKSGARSARKRRWKSSARAAASNAGPRLAEVAGSARRNERSAEIGRDGINRQRLQPKANGCPPSLTYRYNMLYKRQRQVGALSAVKDHEIVSY